MLNLSKPIHVYHSHTKGKLPLRDWVCEWESTVHAKPLQTGVFLVKAHHFLDARQMAKKILRDSIVLCRDFTFKIRVPGLMERAQLQFAPAGTLVEMKALAATTAADPISKT